jgi:hypothetical protein
MDISQMLWPTVDRKEVAHVLDDVNDQVRIETINELRRRDLAALFEAAADNEPLTLDHFVPEDVPPLTEVIHEGKNSLWAFSRFQKRFCRPPSSVAADQLWGYNEHDFRFFTGPGYFVASQVGNEVIIDYCRVPAGKPESWPAILSTRARLSLFVYHGTNDLVRRVSRYVAVGRQRKGEKQKDAWFVLVRRAKTAGARPT